jgi:NRAMP (natural resistance-associated macrophage protein)-like metal ion transporter
MAPKTHSNTNFLKQLGPGLVTGAADDDPSGIGTYSQVGAQFGFGLLWSVLLSLPLMCAVQEISARVGRVTGKGLAENMAVYPRWLVSILIGLLLIANTINIGADIAAMGAAVKLIVGGSALLYACMLAFGCIALEVFVHYDSYARWLKWLTISIFAYVATAFAIHVPWSTAVKATFAPPVAWNADYLIAVTAVLGTTISPYLFFWQASHEVQEIKSVAKDKALNKAPQQASEQLSRIRIDTYAGMFVSALVAYFIILTCAVTLHDHGVTDITSAAQAAEALRPIAGRFAFALFACGIVGTGLLAIPVLAGSAAYGLSGLLKWRAGLERKPRDAKGFYGTIVAATLLGLSLNLFNIDPVKALFWSAVINGIAAVPILWLLMHVASDSRVMGKRFVIPRALRIMGWLTVIVMGFAAAGTLAAIGKN